MFVDTSTSAAWETEYAENMLTCVRPSHPIFSVKLDRYVTVAEMFTCQGLFKHDFHNPSAIDEILKKAPGDAQDLAGNAFASTCAQAQILASLVNAISWTHIAQGDGPAGSDSLIPDTDSLRAPSSSDSLAASVEESDSVRRTSSSNTAKRKSPPSNGSGIENYLTPSGKCAKFNPAPAAKPHKAGFVFAISMSKQLV